MQNLNAKHINKERQFIKQLNNKVKIPIKQNINDLHHGTTNKKQNTVENAACTGHLIVLIKCSY